jgi:anti-sigma regulatory factor (Ser/Thr protein kinase)
VAEVSAVTDLAAEAIWAAVRPLQIDPQSVASAREFAAQFLTDKARLTGDHVDDVVLVVSELVTNAIKYGGNGRRNICLDVGVWSKWTVVTVDDRAPQIHQVSARSGGDELLESGRGLEIVTILAERFWWHRRSISKTANAVILRHGVKLTAEDNAILDGLVAAE